MLPSWDQVVGLATTVGLAIGWFLDRRDRRDKQSRSIVDLKKKLDEAETLVQETKKAAEGAMVEKNREIDLIRDDRRLIHEDRAVWMARCAHLESLVHSDGFRT